VPTYDPETALVIVDVQNDFADPNGSLSVRGGADVVPFLNAEIGRAREAGASVFYTQDWHPESTPHFAKDGGIWPVHCVHDTWGAQLHPNLVVDGRIVRKGSNGEDGYSGFSMRDPETGETIPTELPSLLAADGIRSVVVAGLATDYCVFHTALDARALDFPTTALAAGMRAVDLRPGDGDRALQQMAGAGVVIEDAA
jgi:nicotinamidase/pyrazinamidase